jgi:RNA polymerase sigma factor (sigma-70 family)
MAGGRAGTLGDWFREWQLPLRRFLVRRCAGSSADIDDIAQEVFLRLLRYDRTELVNHPQAYLYKIATNVTAEWAMRSHRRLPHDSQWLMELADMLSPEAEFERDTRHEQLRAAVNDLPPRPREILRLHFEESLKHEDIAKTMGVTRKIVKREITRAYAALRMRLDEESMRTSGQDRKES